VHLNSLNLFEFRSNKGNRTGSAQRDILASGRIQTLATPLCQFIFNNVWNTMGVLCLRLGCGVVGGFEIFLPREFQDFPCQTMTKIMRERSEHENFALFVLFRLKIRSEIVKRRYKRMHINFCAFCEHSTKTNCWWKIPCKRNTFSQEKF